MENKLLVSPSPHIFAKDTTTSIMLDVIIALAPALIAAILLFGPRALLLTAVCVATCIASEYISRKVMKRPQTIGDLSAVVTGMLLALNLPVTIKLWMAALGCVIAIVVVKQMFGGIGHNFMNPALVARIVLTVSFANQMTVFTAPFDGTTTATPLQLLAQNSSQLPSVFDMLIGNHGGSMGETCSIALILGGIYLLARHVISPVIPLSFVGTVALLTALLGANPLYHVLSGGLLLGAIFMATDYTTSPLTQKGKLIFGIGCGALTVLIRQFAALPEGVSYSIVLMNILTPHINRLTRITPFGRKEAVK